MPQVFRANMTKLLGLALFRQDSIDEAKMYFEEARFIFWQHGIIHGTACCDLALGHAKMTKDPISAMAHLDMCVQFYDIIGGLYSAEVALKLKK